MFSPECSAPSKAVDVDFEDRGVVDEAVDSGRAMAGPRRAFPSPCVPEPDFYLKAERGAQNVPFSRQNSERSNNDWNNETIA